MRERGGNVPLHGSRQTASPRFSPPNPPPSPSASSVSPPPHPRAEQKMAALQQNNHREERREATNIKNITNTDITQPPHTHPTHPPHPPLPSTIATHPRAEQKMLATSFVVEPLMDPLFSDLSCEGLDSTVVAQVDREVEEFRLTLEQHSNDVRRRRPMPAHLDVSAFSKPRID